MPREYNRNDINRYRNALTPYLSPGHSFTPHDNPVR